VKVLEKRDRLERAGATAVFIVHDEPGLVRRTMLAGLDVPYPVLVDSDRRAYRAWGLRRGSVLDTWLYPRAWVTYARLLLGGRDRFRGRGRDTLQLGGDFIVAGDGTIVYSRPQSRDDRPPVAVLLHVLEQSGHIDRH
jgi:hypothetical protein